ncbi:MAG TPA: ABC transporter permease [Chloroflexota bacterium]|nr:ABC transporter permease [Chloroflexota bacterium]
MLSFVIRRFALLVPVIFVISLLTFGSGHLAPGGPFDQAGLGRELPAPVIANLNRTFHLDAPVWKQYLIYMGNFLQGDLGPSYQFQGESVSKLIFSPVEPHAPFWDSRFGKSAELGLIAFAIACIVGIPLGVVSAVRQNTWVDYLALVFATAGITVPSFIIAIFFMVIFGVDLHWFPVVTVDYGDWHAWVLPSVTLSLGLLAFLARLTRASMLESLRQDYIRTARAKGLHWRAVVLKHALRNSLIPVTTVLGPALAGLVTGSFIIEFVFSFPGMGQFFVQGVTARDYSMVMGVTLFYAILISCANLLVDVAYAVLDPRIKVS